MKPYGIKRNLNLEFPDMGDISTFGLKSRVGKYRSKSGDYKNSFRSSKNKKATRRIYKRLARIEGNEEIKSEIADN